MAVPSARIRISRSTGTPLRLGDDSGSIRCGDAPALVDFLFARPAPRAAVLFKQFFRLDGPPGAGCVIGESARGQRVPYVEDGLNHTPARFDHVRALEECGVARHAIAEKTFIAGVVLAGNMRGVAKPLLEDPAFQPRAGNLGAKAKGVPFLGLKIND